MQVLATGHPILPKVILEQKIPFILEICYHIVEASKYGLLGSLKILVQKDGKSWTPTGAFTN